VLNGWKEFYTIGSLGSVVVKAASQPFVDWDEAMTQDTLC
jgi:hypothetical protein